MNTDLILMFGALILLIISGLLVFCFTEAKGKNTPHARRLRSDNVESLKTEVVERSPEAPMTMEKHTA